MLSSHWTLEVHDFQGFFFPSLSEAFTFIPWRISMFHPTLLVKVGKTPFTWADSRRPWSSWTAIRSEVAVRLPTIAFPHVAVRVIGQILLLILMAPLLPSVGLAWFFSYISDDEAPPPTMRPSPPELTRDSIVSQDWECDD